MFTSLSHFTRQPLVSAPAMPMIKYVQNRSNLTCAIGHRRVAFDTPDILYRTYCNLSASRCICSEGCGSSWLCRPSELCNTPSPPNVSADDRPLPPRVALLLFLMYNRSLVRTKFQHKPWLAYDREFNRISWFIRSAGKVKTRLPLHVIVGPERDLSKERKLIQEGHRHKVNVSVTEGPFVVPPLWANRYHRLTFGKIGALALTQFDKVFVFDNDMALAHNIDHLAFVQTPSAVWHTSMARWQWRHNESCAVTTGLLGLTPSAAEFGRALRHLYSMSNKSTYDGGDQEFWRLFYTWYELPLRYQAHQALNMPARDWHEIRVIHSISALREVNRIPKDMRHLIKYYY